MGPVKNVKVDCVHKTAVFTLSDPEFEYQEALNQLAESNKAFQGWELKQ